MPVSPADVGRRITIRRRLSGGGSADQLGRQLYADVVGHLESWEGDRLVVRRRDGSLVELDATTLVAGHVVPSQPASRGGVAADLAELAEVAGLGWRPTDDTWLGRWWLRAAEGFTGRANSVIPLGDPGVPLEAALDRVRDWYGVRGLPPRIQLEPGSALDRDLDVRGWSTDAERGGVLVQAAALDAALDAAHAGAESRAPAVTAVIESEPPAGWLSIYRGPAPLPPVAMRVLAEHPRLAFAALREGGRVVAGGRGTVDRGWLGIAGVEVVPDRRHSGLGLVIVAALLEWGRRQAAERAYLQVSAENVAARKLYSGLGFATSYRYHYRLAP